MSKVGQAIVEARKGDTEKAVNMIGDSVAYVLERSGITSDNETSLFNQLYNGKKPTNISEIFGAIQPFQYYDCAFRIEENKDVLGKHYNWKYSGRSPIDIVKDLKVHPQWYFDTDFGIWRLKQPVDFNNYLLMLYPKQMVTAYKNKDFDFTRMWYWRGSLVESSQNILLQAKAADNEDDPTAQFYSHTLFQEQQPRVIAMVKKINDIVEREYASLVKSYNLLEHEIILQVGILYAEKTERNPEKYIENWSKMDESERATYLKIEKLKPVDEKAIPRIDFYSDIRGRVKDRAVKGKDEDEFTPIKSRDDGPKLWRRGYELYKKTIDEEGEAGISKLKDELREKTSIEVRAKVKAKIDKEQEERDVKEATDSTDSDDLKALKQKLGNLQKINPVELTEQQKADKEKTLEDISKLENPDVNEEQPVIPTTGGWSTQNIETDKNADSEIKEQEQYHDILNKEIAKSETKLKSLVVRSTGAGAPVWSTMDFKKMSSGNDPDFSKEQLEQVLTKDYDTRFKKNNSDLSKDELSRLHQAIWGDQQLNNPAKDINWSNYDFLLKRYRIPRDSGIEKFRKSQDHPTATATKNDEEIRWTTDQIVGDKTQEEMDKLEDKKLEISKRLISNEDKKTRDELEEVKKELKQLKGGEIKEAGDPIKKLADDDSKKSSVSESIGKTVEIASKAKNIYDKVDTFLDNIKPIDPDLPALEIAKEETRKDTDMQKKVLDLLDKYDDLEKKESDIEIKKISDAYQAKLNKISEREARQQRIKESGFGKKKILSYIMGSGDDKAKEPSKMEKVEKAVQIVDQIADQLEKFDGSKYNEDRKDDRVATPVKEPTRHNRGSGSTVKKPNPWLEHIKQFREAHPDLKFKDVLKQAKETYSKK